MAGRMRTDDPAAPPAEMRERRRVRRRAVFVAALVAALVLAFVHARGGTAAASPGAEATALPAAVAGLPAELAPDAGREMYRRAILPSGEPMQAEMRGGEPVRGTTFACASCHTRSGLGTVEEGFRTPPINGANLFRPFHRYYPSLTESERSELLPERFKVPPLRPAYTDASLGEAIRNGVDPRGRTLNAVMPRFPLSGRDMAVLVHYLRNLSSRPSPGVTDSTIALATVVTDETTAGDRNAMLAPMEWAVRSHNNLGPSPGHMSRMFSMQVMAIGFRRWTFSCWTLTGPPDTWRAQLEDYYRAEPVFALVGGLSSRTWKPIHEFCEQEEIPCILPLTDLPVVSQNSFYTLYFSKGYYQEGEAVARYVDAARDANRPRTVVQVLGPGPEAAALAAGFQDAWAGSDGVELRTVRLEEGAPLTAELLSGLVPDGRNSALVLWSGPEAYDALRSLAARPDRPPRVFLSSTRLGERLWDLPSDARSLALFSYPFREPGEKILRPREGRKWPVVVNKEYRRNDRRIASRTETLLTLAADALNRLERDFYRDRLLDLVDMSAAQEHSDYEVLGFGSGQRYASESCHIMQISDGSDCSLIRVE
jgi:hypothetical protein